MIQIPNSKYQIPKRLTPDLGFGVWNLGLGIFSGELSEWSKEHAWKVCKRQKRFVGSNPTLSAMMEGT